MTQWKPGQSGNPKGRPKTGAGTTIAMYVRPELANRVRRLADVSDTPYTRIISKYIERNIEQLEDWVIAGGADR